MSENSIPGLNEFVITCIDCRPVVSEKSLSQPVSSFEPVLAFVPVLSNLSRVSTIFPTAVTRSSWLQPSYHHNMPKNPNKELDHRRLSDALVVIRRCFRYLITWASI